MTFFRRILITLLCLLPGAAGLFAQQTERKDSLVKELSAQSAQLLEIDGVSYRKVIGPARFLHNNTYLLCDTALWNVNDKIINAIGNVKIIQDQTILSSDKLDYLIDEDLAQFRGTLVQLQDKDRNTLRTHHLDYNTRDSVAIFRNGGAMRDKDGQIIESRTGTYDSKTKLFTFSERVNMFTDSVFVKTSKLVYDAGNNVATFGNKTFAWKEDNMLSADGGWYDRLREVFFFHKHVHVMNKTQEGWADSLFFHRLTNDVELLGHAQLIDTSRNVAALAGRVFYEDSLKRVTLTRDPAVIGQTEEKTRVDTVWFGADSMVYRAIRVCDIDSSLVKLAKERRDEVETDPVMEYRRKAALEAAKAKEEAAKKAAENDPNEIGKRKAAELAAEKERLEKEKAEKLKAEKEKAEKAVQDTLKAVSDTLSVVSDTLSAVSDTLSAGTDTLLAGSDSLSVADSLAVPEVPKDTSRLGFLTAVGNVRVFRRDMQVACDSLLYCDLDSLARLYLDPIVWNEGVRQYSADSMTVVVRNRMLSKASLMSNAFITVQEDTLCYDQIRATEMLAYFDSTGVLARFDALGGATALFYIEENGALATVNKVDTKMLSALMANGTLDCLYYFDDPKNDACPSAQLRDEERRLKGFRWDPDRRPNGPEDITELTLRPSERARYEEEPRADYPQTEVYFPGYMAEVYQGLERIDSLKRVRRAEEQRLEQERLEQERLDKEQLEPEQEQEPEQTPDPVIEGLPETSETAVTTATEVVAAVKDSLAAPPVLTPEQQKKAEREAKQKAAEEARQARIAAREARWAELDARDAAKKAAKEQKALERQQRKEAKLNRAYEKRLAREQRLIEKYKARYEKRQARKKD